jgi:hypothetical protein
MPFRGALRTIGVGVVALTLAFVLLPAVVVAIAAFNARAVLAFPPDALSWRWFAKALAYEDFRAGFHNGLIVTAFASTIALAVGAAFAFALDRYSFPLKRMLEGVLLAPLVIPHFTIGLGFLILAAELGATRGFAVVIACHVILVLPFVLRSVYISLRNLDRRLELAAGSRQRLAVCRDPLVQRVHRVAVRHLAAHANASGRHVQLRARICRSLDGGRLGHVYRGDGAALDHRQYLFRPRQGFECRRCPLSLVRGRDERLGKPRQRFCAR